MAPETPSEHAENDPSPDRRRTVGRYELRAELGSGGMGTVWRAFDPSLERDVAVKEVHLPPDLPARERGRARARVVREARAAARISHPSVVTVHDVLEVDGTPFIVMELLDGESLRDRLRRSGPMPEHEVEGLARPLLAALRAAHGSGVVHRDVKPANIMLSEEGRRPVLTDFGIANLPDAAGTALTGTGAILGTAEYAAPERLDRDGTMPSSDLWSLGVTLFAALTGASPFKRETLTPTLTAVLTAPVPPPPASGPVAAVVGGLMDRDPVRRLDPDRALALLEGTGSAPRPAAPAGPPPGAAPSAAVPRRPAPEHSRRRPPGWVVAAGLAVVLVATGLGSATAWTLTRNGAGTGDGPAATDAAGSGSPEATGAEAATVTGGAAGTVPEGFAVLEDDAVRLAYPEGWEPVDVTDEYDGSDASARLAEYDFGTDVDTATVTVSVTLQDVVLHSAGDSLLRMEEILLDGAEFTDVERVRLESGYTPDGFGTAVWEATFRDGEREVPERWMLAREITDPEDRLRYRLTLNLPATVREEYRDVLEEVVASLEPVA